jgi:hypothetical protein
VAILSRHWNALGTIWFAFDGIVFGFACFGVEFLFPYGMFGLSGYGYIVPETRPGYAFVVAP